MPPDGELSGIVTQQHGIVQEAVRMDTAPLSPLGGNLHRVLDDRQTGRAIAFQNSASRRAR
jgi:hypothetical protein